MCGLVFILNGASLFAGNNSRCRLNNRSFPDLQRWSTAVSTWQSGLPSCNTNHKKKGFRLVAGHRALADIFLLIFAALLAVLPVLRFNSIGPDIVWAELLRPDKFFTDAIIFHRLIPRKKLTKASRFLFFSIGIWWAPPQFLFEYLLWGELL